MSTYSVSAEHIAAFRKSWKVDSVSSSVDGSSLIWSVAPLNEVSGLKLSDRPRAAAGGRRAN